MPNSFNSKIIEIYKSKPRKVWIVIVVIVLLIAVGVSALSILYYKNSANNNPLGGQNSKQSETPYVVPALTQDYSNSTYKFSLKIPEDFEVRESQIDGGTTLVFENTKAEGVQIRIAGFDESVLAVENGVKVFDVDFIQKNIQDMKILESQPIEIGKGYRGVAFKSDNEAFDGASREVWFVFRGTLYQISTYERFDELLKEMFATWKFN